MDDDMEDEGLVGGSASTEVLPRSIIAKLVKDRLPPSLRAGNDTIALLQECTSEFLQMVTSEANDACSEAGRKTISEEHILNALCKLDFARFADQCAAINGEEHDAKAALKEKKKRRKEAISHLTPEELLAEQQKLFAGARQRMEGATPPG